MMFIEAVLLQPKLVLFKLSLIDLLKLQGNELMSISRDLLLLLLIIDTSVNELF